MSWERSGPPKAGIYKSIPDRIAAIEATQVEFDERLKRIEGALFALGFSLAPKNDTLCHYVGFETPVTDVHIREIEWRLRQLDGGRTPEPDGIARAT